MKQILVCSHYWTLKYGKKISFFYAHFFWRKRFLWFISSPEGDLVLFFRKKHKLVPMGFVWKPNFWSSTSSRARNVDSTVFIIHFWPLWRWNIAFDDENEVYKLYLHRNRLQLQSLSDSTLRISLQRLLIGNLRVVAGFRLYSP